MQNRREAILKVDELECDGDDDCTETPDWVADADEMLLSFVGDDHRDIFPEDTLTPIEEAIRHV